MLDSLPAPSPPGNLAGEGLTMHRAALDRRSSTSEPRRTLRPAEEALVPIVHASTSLASLPRHLAR